jgi:hypothetical protein
MTHLMPQNNTIRGVVTGWLADQTERIPSKLGFNRCWSGLRWANREGSFEFDLSRASFLRLAAVAGAEGPEGPDDSAERTVGDEARFRVGLLRGGGCCGETATRGRVAAGSGAVPSVVGRGGGSYLYLNAETRPLKVWRPALLGWGKSMAMAG